MKKKTKDIISTFLLPALGIILCIVSIFVFITKSNRLSREDAYGNLVSEFEITRTALQKDIEGVYDSLTTMASSLEISHITDIPTVTAVMNNVVQNGMLTGMAYIQPDGKAYFSSGNTGDVSQTTYFQRAMNGEKNVEYIHENVESGNPILVISVPIYQNGAIICIISGVIPTGAFSQILNVRSYENGNCAIVDSNGLTIIRDVENSIEEENVLEFYKNSVSFLGGKDVNSIAEDMQNRISGHAEYIYNGLTRCLSYNYIGENDWYMISSVPSNVVYERSSQQLKAAITLGVEILFCLSIVAAALLYNEMKNKKVIDEEREKLYESEQRYKVADEFSQSVLFDADLMNDVFTCNKNFSEIYRTEPFVKKVSDFFKINPYICEEDMEEYLRMGREILSGSDSLTAHYRIIREDGEMIWCRVNTKCIYDKDGRPVHIIGRITNIDKEKKKLDLLMNKADKDPLTRLLNREAAKERINLFLSGEGKSGLHAFMMVDVDNFKTVNDTYGHKVGDDVLQAVSFELMGLFRSADVIARLGGDEFVVFMKDVRTVSQVKNKARALNHAVKNIGEHKTNGIELSCSIGIALSPEDGRNFDELYPKADNAMYVSKKAQKGIITVFGMENEQNGNDVDFAK